MKTYGNVALEWFVKFAHEALDEDSRERLAQKAREHMAAITTEIAENPNTSPTIDEFVLEWYLESHTT